MREKLELPLHKIVYNRKSRGRKQKLSMSYFSIVYAEAADINSLNALRTCLELKRRNHNPFRLVFLYHQMKPELLVEFYWLQSFSHHWQG